MVDEAAHGSADGSAHGSADGSVRATALGRDALRVRLVLLGCLMAVGVLGLSGFGVYVGRFARFNSWDLFTRPRRLLYHVGSDVVAGDSPRAVVVTALMASFLIVSYVTVEMLTRVDRYADGSRESGDGTWWASPEIVEGS